MKGLAKDGDGRGQCIARRSGSETAGWGVNPNSGTCYWGGLREDTYHF